MTWLTSLALIILISWAFERFFLRGNRQPEYPVPVAPGVISRFTNPHGPGPEHDIVVKTVEELTRQISQASAKDRIKIARKNIDSMSDGRDYVSQFLSVDAGGVPAEWVIAPGTDGSKRMLYIHGGGFMMGSAKSHRTITSKFSEITGAAVLVIDYRLLPEHKHMDCVEDCRTAYRWILENGPDGPAELQQLLVAGDSAGGNLTLSLIAWVRDTGLRTADAVIAFSPLTDSTFSGASIRSNAATDVMLEPIMGALNRLPRFARSCWVTWAHRMRPANPILSPLFGDLSGLPPMLVQASEAEMLLDDARRYVYKACASGSPVKLQTWTDMVHVWQIFEPDLPQATEAWNEVSKFIKKYSPV